MKKLLFLLLLGCASVQAAELSVVDAKGATHRPFAETRKDKAVTLFFVTTDCPIANRYAPEINRICRDYEKRGVAFYIVQTDRKLKAADAVAHAKEYGFTCPVLLDRKHELVKRAAATVTPEAVIFAPSGKVLYRGRIDDRYPRLGQMREEPTRRDLRLALDAIIQGKKVPIASTKAIGCYIEDSL